MTRRLVWVMVVMAAALAGCEGLLLEEDGFSDGGGSVDGERARVTRVIDGDTIDVEIGGEVYRVRYVGANTPERDEACYSDAVRANRNLVENETVTLVSDVSDTDRYDRLLRYVYVGDTLVNAEMIRQGYAEVVLYEPDRAQYENFRQLEREAARAGRGCHPTGIFDDGSDRR